MKQCGVCGNSYEDRVRHCPMDGTALSTMTSSGQPAAAINRSAANSLQNQSSIHSSSKTAIEEDDQFSSTERVFRMSQQARDNAEELDSADLIERTEAAPMAARQISSEDLSGRVLNNTYRLESKIGHGGMGAVYKATHLKIGDSVAIKFITEEMAKNPLIVARFQREALAARKISHPDAVTVYEMSETQDGLLFIVMQYVEGERLDHYLNRAFPLTGRRILHLLRCIVDVLDAAHRAGIVHRDLKPSNMLLYTNSRGEERIKVLDFGIAKMIDMGEAFEEIASLTQKGDIFGSPYFMSPEQAMGTGVDIRADIYSLGVLAYQMVTGKLPFEGKTGREVIDKLLSEQPVPPSELVDTDMDYDGVILKALAKEPGYRHRTVMEFINDFESSFSSLSSDAHWRFNDNSSGPLGNLANVNISVPLPQLEATEAVGRALSGPLSSRSFDSIAERISLAILPLKCLSADEQARILSVGLVDTLINELTIVRDLIVRPIRAVLKYENSEVDIITAGRRLSVDFVMDGSVQTFGQRVRVSFHLVDVNQNQEVWQDRFDVLAEDPFVVQDTVARRIVENLRINLTDYEKEQISQMSQSLNDAQQYYIRGRHFFERAIEMHDLEVALQMYLRAIELNPNFARAYTGIAQCHYIIQTGFDDTTEHINIAEHACRQAMQLDPSLADAYATMACIYMDIGRRNEVLDLVSKALLLSPNNLEADLCLGWYYRSAGQLEKSLAAYKRAMREDPTYWRCYWGICIACVYQGRFEDAERVIDTYLKSLDPRHPVMLFLKGMIGIYKNQLTESEALGTRLNRIAPGLPCGDLLLAQVYAARRDAKRVNSYLGAINRRFGPKEDLFYWYSQIYSRCGLLSNAIEYLKKSIAEGNYNYQWFIQDPALEHLRATPAFSHLINNSSNRANI